MATEILAADTTAASSSDVVVVAGTPITVGLKPISAIPPKALLVIEQYDGAVYGGIKDGELSAARPSVTIAGPGTYRVRRPVQEAAVGVFQE